MVKLFLALLFGFFLLSCSSDDNSGGGNFTPINNNIKLTTIEATDITANSAKSGGNITEDGGKLITERGICWDINPNPTIADSKIEMGEGSGTFEALMSGLEPGTEYFYKSYAINEDGIAYGSELSFSTRLKETISFDMTGYFNLNVDNKTYASFTEPNYTMYLYGWGDSLYIQFIVDSFVTKDVDLDSGVFIDEVIAVQMYFAEDDSVLTDLFVPLDFDISLYSDSSIFTIEFEGSFYSTSLFATRPTKYLNITNGILVDYK